MLLLNAKVAIAVTANIITIIAPTSGNIDAHSQPCVVIVLIGVIVCVIGFHSAMAWSQLGISSFGNNALLVNISGIVRKFITTIRVSWLLMTAPKASDMLESIKHKTIAISITATMPSGPVVTFAPKAIAAKSINVA